MELDEQLCKNHLLLSAVDPPHGADCRRVHRFVCLTVLLSSLLTLAAVWYGLVHSASQYELITGTSVFRIHDVVVALVVSLVSFTLAALILEVLNCSKIKVYIHLKHYPTVSRANRTIYSPTTKYLTPAEEKRCACISPLLYFFN